MTLFVEPAVHVTDQRAFLELAALPQLRAELITVRLRPVLDLAVEFARDDFQFRPAYSVGVDLVLEEPPLPFPELNIGRPAESLAHALERLSVRRRHRAYPACLRA